MRKSSEFAPSPAVRPENETPKVAPSPSAQFERQNNIKTGCLGESSGRGGGESSRIDRSVFAESALLVESIDLEKARRQASAGTARNLHDSLSLYT